MKSDELSSDFGICRRTESGEVYFQNAISDDLCGSKVGDVCDKCDLSRSLEEGLDYSDRLLLQGKPTQVVHLKTLDSTTTVLYSLESVDRELRTKLKSCELTATEFRVADLILKKQSNLQICDALSITRSTLKSHINHLYEKANFLKKWRLNAVH